MKLRLNISPCPNDTFAFDALINQRIDTGGLEFDVVYEDIEQLNNHLMSGSYSVHISKMSYAILPDILPAYRLLDSGSALGHGNGPVLVALHDYTDEELPALRIAIPGQYTTANMLMDRLFPCVADKPEYLFSEVAGAICDGEVDAGVMIHEGRFTYPERGLRLLHDLGVLWEKVNALPLPLGGIVVSRTLSPKLQTKIGELLRRSVEYAFAHPEASREFVRCHAQELDDEVIDGHIRMFVNDHSLTLGDQGREAICRLLDMDANTLFS